MNNLFFHLCEVLLRNLGDGGQFCVVLSCDLNQISNNIKIQNLIIVPYFIVPASNGSKAYIQSCNSFSFVCSNIPLCFVHIEKVLVPYTCKKID